MIRSLTFLAAMLLGLAGCEQQPPAATPAPEADPAPHVTKHIRSPGHLILVTGATGTQGGAVARELLRRGHTVRGLTRDAQSDAAQALQSLGAEMVEGNFDDPGSLASAMEGVYGVFAVTLFWQYGYEAEVQQGVDLIDQAVKAGVKHFVYTSVASADQETGIPHFDSKWEVEQYLHSSELRWTIVRPVEFMDNWRWSLDNFRAGKLIDPRDPESRHQWIASDDIGFFVAEAFDNPDDWAGVTEEIAGDELRLSQLQAVLSEAFGREFEYIQPSWTDYQAQAGEEITLMVRWFEEEGYSVNVPELRRTYPNLQTAAKYLSGLAASTEQ